MSKRHKKRTKRYHGEDAQAPLKPTVHHYEAIQRGPIGEWWQAHKRGYIRWIAIGAGGILVIWLLVDAFRAITGS